MKSNAAKLMDFFKKSHQFVIPIYQRTYSWTEKECLQLWDDLLRAGSDAQVSAHFVGSIVYIEKGLYQVSSQSPMLVIDGQQRLTTLTLLEQYHSYYNVQRRSLNQAWASFAVMDGSRFEMA